MSLTRLASVCHEFNTLGFSVSCQGLKLWVDQIYLSIAKLLAYIREGRLTEL